MENNTIHGAIARGTVSPTEKYLALCTLLLGGIALWFFLWCSPIKEKTVTELMLPFGLFWGMYLLFFYVFTWKRSKRSLWGFLLTLCILLLYFRGYWYEEPVLRLLNFLVLPLLLMLHMPVSLYNFPAEAELRVLPLYLAGFFVWPFSCPGRFFSALVGPSREGKEGRKALFLGLGLGIPLLVLAGSLLIKADGVMDYYYHFLLREAEFPRFFRRSFLVLVTALLFFSFLHRAAFGEEKEIWKKPHPKCFPALSFQIVLGMLLLLYVLFFFVQFAYLTGLKGLPSTLSYSEYAVSGFWELCLVAGINLALFLFGIHFARGARGTKGLLLLLLLAALLMELCSGFRLYLYIEAYGLTRARLFSAWFILLLFVLSLLCLWRLFHRDFRLLGAMAAAVCVLYLGLNLVNLDGIIAKSVLQKADARGTLSQVDADFLRYTLSADARKILLESEWRYAIYYDVEPEYLVP